MRRCLTARSGQQSVYEAACGSLRNAVCVQPAVTAAALACQSTGQPRSVLGEVAGIPTSPLEEEEEDIDNEPDTTRTNAEDINMTVCLRQCQARTSLDPSIATGGAGVSGPYHPLDPLY